MHDLSDTPTRSELVWTLLAIAFVAVAARFAVPFLA